jgi:hypothetical protein
LSISSLSSQRPQFRENILRFPRIVLVGTTAKFCFTMIWPLFRSLLVFSPLLHTAFATIYENNNNGVAISQPLHRLKQRDNTGCMRTCSTKDDKMDTWGNWQGCKSSYKQGSGTKVLEKQDQYSNNRNNLVWKHDSCWTNVVSTYAF